MISSYKARIAALGSYDGEYKRKHAQKIMDASWKRDAATKPVYVKWVDSGLPEVKSDDVPVYAKFNVKSYHNITGDEVAYLLQFRLEDMQNNPDIKVGSYVQIRNEMDKPEWWLIWHLDDRPQFRQCTILKCTWVYQWTSFKDGHRVIHQCLGVTRNQNNYNSGCWLDYTFEVVEQQHVMLMPSNDDTNILTYNTRMLVSNEGRFPPIAWKISKVQPSVTSDTVRFTMTQEQYNAATDNADLMIADYTKFSVTPELADTDKEHDGTNLEIVYSGSPAVRAGGGFKKFVLKSIVDGELVDPIGDVDWSFDFGNNRENIEDDADGNEYRVKCKPNYSLIGSTFTITAQYGGSTKSLVVEVISL